MLEFVREQRVSNQAKVDEIWDQHSPIAYLTKEEADDEFSQELHAAVDSLEEFLAPYLGRQPA